MKVAETEEGLKQLYNEAKKIDEEAIKKISPNDKKRIIRILEIYHSTGKTKTQQEIESRKNEVKYDYKIFGINMERELLYERINKRVDIMIEMGLIEEVKKLIEKYPEFPTAMQAIGYKEIVEFLNGEISKEEAIEKIKQETRRYAKRQLTWFKRIEGIKWINGLDDVQKNINFILNS
jgi:tRNA dimethylallyltransferase